MPRVVELPPPAPLPEGPDGPMRAHDPMCFGCGPENAAGLHLRFERDGDVVRTPLTLPERHVGAPGLAHGGVVCAILDDVCGAVPMVLQARSVTAKLDVDFAAPVVLGRALVAEAWLVSFEGRKLRIASRLLEGDQVLATGRALFITVPREHFAPRDDASPSIAP